MKKLPFPLAQRPGAAHGIREVEERWYQAIAAWKLRVLRPLVRLLAWVGATPDAVSYAGLAMLAGYLALLPRSPRGALAFLLLNILCDGLDGSLARYRGLTSDHGKFTDMLCDSISFTVVVLGLMLAGIVNPILGAVYIYVSLVMEVLAIIREQRRAASEWLLSPRAGAFAHLFKSLTYLLVVLWALAGVNVWDPAIGLFTLGTIAAAIYHYVRIKRDAGRGAATAARAPRRGP